MQDVALKSGLEITVTFPDGKTRCYPQGTTGLAVAESISKSLAKAAIAVRVNGQLHDLGRVIEGDATISIVKREDADALDMIRHDCAHVLAEAVQNLYPGTQVTIGPNIENGFFYDFARNEPFTLEDLPKIEAEMRKIIERGAAFEREVWDRDDAIAYFTKKNEMYKAELIRDLPGTETITIYKQGAWLDLCRGPHMPTTKQVGLAFKLMKVAGAYWRGDSSKAMLTRIYGTAWRTSEDLAAYLMQIEEAEKRDHRKLGREMDLFHLQDEAQGSVFWHPKGYQIWLALEGYMRRRLQDGGYQEVKTPQLMDSRFWEASGHWGKYRENMFVVPDVVPNTEEGEKVFQEDPKHFMALKPMNCPAHVQIFKQGTKSYRDLPLRLAEFGCCHRNEAHGALHGIMRVRQFTQDDAHIFCRDDQILSESIRFCKLTQTVYKDLGFDDYVIKLETRPAKRIGSDELWDKAENGLKEALDELGIEYSISEGDGALAAFHDRHGGPCVGDGAAARGRGGDAQGGFRIRENHGICERLEEGDERFVDDREAGQRCPNETHAGGVVLEREGAVSGDGMAGGIRGDGAELETACERRARGDGPGAAGAPEAEHQVGGAAGAVEHDVDLRTAGDAEGSGGDGLVGDE